MNIKTKSIGSFEAKTHLSNLLDKVQRGYEYIITKRGKPVAKLIPYTNNEENEKIEDLIAKFDNIRKSIGENINIIDYIREGRKY